MDQSRNNSWKINSLENKSKLPLHQHDKDPQSSSTLFRLPGELRNSIYAILFSSTRLGFARRRTQKKRTRPAANSLAILRSCRRVYHEAKGLWLGNVLFSFDNAEYLMNKLSTLPTRTLSAIRHLRTGGRAVMISPPNTYDQAYYRVPHVLKFLPGLCLDSLTVIGDPYMSAEVMYQTTEFFVIYGHGWKELRVISPSLDMLAFKTMIGNSEPPMYQRKPQPRNWNEAILRRDGQDSGASVTIYRSRGSGSVLEPSNREPFNQNVTSSKELENFGSTVDLDLDHERGKQFLIVVKRGRNADILSTGPIQLGGYDLRDWADGLTWAQIIKDRTVFSLKSDEVEGNGNEGEGNDEEDPESDVYDDPDEYQFSPYLKR